MNEILLWIILITGIITFIIEMVTMYKVQEKGNIVAWNIFLATCFGYYITSVTAGLSGSFYYDRGHATSLDEALRPYISLFCFCILPAIINSIVLAAGTKTKDNRKDPKIKLNIFFVVTFITCILINVLIFVCLHLILGK